MSITDQNINSDVFTAIRTVIVSANPKVTNSTTSKTKITSTLAVNNDETISMPQIVIIPADISEGEFKFGGTEGKKLINVGVECYYKNTLGVDQLSDAVKHAIKAACANNTISGMSLVGVSENYALGTTDESKVHLKTIVFTFDRE